MSMNSFPRDGGKSGRGQPRPHATQQGAITPGQGESPAAGNVAESRLDPTPDRIEHPPSHGTSPAPHQFSGLWCLDGERGGFVKGENRCKRCPLVAWQHWTTPPVATRSKGP